MNEPLYDLKITDRKSFSQFLEVLREDLINNPDGWENKTLPDFLEALATYTEDIQGYYDNTDANIKADVPSWSTFADIFKGAKVYE